VGQRGAFENDRPNARLVQPFEDVAQFAVADQRFDGGLANNREPCFKWRSLAEFIGQKWTNVGVEERVQLMAP
jgi:hypothetical protein